MLPLESALAPRLRALAFRKRGRTWWRDESDVVQVLNLQSVAGQQLFVNVGVYVKRLGEQGSPPVNQCHISARLERVIPSAHELIRSADPHGTVDPLLVELIASEGVAWLSSVATLGGIARYIVDGGSTKGLVGASIAALACTRS